METKAEHVTIFRHSIFVNNPEKRADWLYACARIGHRTRAARDGHLQIAVGTFATVKRT
jgi:hypothetical protein